MKKDKRKLYDSEKIANFRQLVNKYKTLYADKTAFEFKENPHAKEHIKISYKQFSEDIESLGTALLNLNLRSARIGIIAPNRYEWCVSYLAITTSDMVVVPLDKSLPNNEIEDLVKRSKIDAIIFDKKYSEIFSKIQKEQSSDLKHFICMDENTDFTSYSHLLNQGKSLITNGDTAYKNIEIDNKKMSIMLFTSGTTSISKAVALSQSNICEDIYALSQMTDIRKEDVFLSFLPLHHTFESTCTFLYGTSCGITVAFCDGLKYVQKNLSEFHITGFVCVPLMLEIMYKKMKKAIDEQGKTKLVARMSKVCNFLLKFKIDIRRTVFKQILNSLGGNLRVLIAGGAAMSKDAIQGFLDLGINLLQGYGLTETSPVLAGENDKYKRAGSVGFPLPGLDVKIDNPNSEGIGEILAHGPTVMIGYVDNQEATDEVLKDGWFHTGDLGYFDKDGFLFITGRKKDVIVLKNGKNIFPEELELLINKLPYVSESIVFGRPCDDGDYKICAKIVYNIDELKKAFPDASESDYKNLIWDDIKNKVNHTMPAYKYIREIIITDTPLIKTTTQKIKRHEEIKQILNKK
mgnify:FL=1